MPSLAPADVEGSGDDTPLFNGTGRRLVYLMDLLHTRICLHINVHHDILMKLCAEGKIRDLHLDVVKNKNPSKALSLFLLLSL